MKETEKRMEDMLHKTFIEFMIIYISILIVCKHTCTLAENDWKEWVCVCGGGGVLSFRQMATKSIFLSMNIRKMVVNATISCIMHSIYKDVKYTKSDNFWIHPRKLDVNQFEFDTDMWSSE